MNLIYRRYLIDVRPQHRETLPSYTARLLAANQETEQHRQLLIRQAGPSQRIADKEATWLTLLATKTKRTQFHFDADPHGWLDHPDGTSCDSCTAGLGERILCTHCAHGALVRQHPHFDTPVCLRHHRWVGFTDRAGDQHPAAASVVHAAHQFASLRRQHRLDLRLFTMFSAAVNDTLVAPRPVDRSANAETFPRVIALATHLSSVNFCRTFFDPSRPFQDSYHSLVEMVTTVLGRDEAEIVRAIWLYVRPTVWAIRNSIITGTQYTTAWAHDLPLPLAATDVFLHAKVPSEPFSNYLEITGDTQLSAARHGVKNAQQGARKIVTLAKTATDRHLAICAAGHQYDSPTPVAVNLTNGKTPPCPVCRHRLIVPGYNDLRTTHPAIAAEFDVPLNNGLTPRQIGQSSRSKYYWRCPVGHSYSATAGTRTSSKSQCPLCQGRQIVAGINVLSTTHPELVAEWHPAFMHYQAPTSLSAGSNAIVQWLCPKNHTYEMRVWDRTHGKGCLECTRAENRATAINLTITHPKLASEWHPTLNGDAEASSYTAGGRRKGLLEMPRWSPLQTANRTSSRRLQLQRMFTSNSCSKRQRPSHYSARACPRMAPVPQQQKTIANVRRHRQILVEMPRQQSQLPAKRPAPNHIPRVPRVPT